MPENVGKVYLIGAGPGDPKLLTLRAVECLQRADVVLYDGLANPRMLSHVRSDCEKVCVGKHGQSRVWTQSEIDDEMVRFAKLGRNVARLKGGDPAVFARTAEELDRLVREGIPFEVVPGITAALAASSYAGIPITHRDWASAVAFVTAQTQAIDGGSEAEEPLDWDALARFPGTLVFYMGVTTASRWSSRLIEAGKSPQTPTALIRKCSLPDQEIVHCQLGEVADRLVPASAFRPPVITIVGNVTTLGPTLDWFSKRPLFGTSILLTRPIEQTDRWRQTLEELGAEVLFQPVIEITKLGKSDDRNTIESSRWLERIEEFDWILFASRHGVKHFIERLWETGRDLRQLGRARLAAVGPSTAEALEAYHLRCDRVPVAHFGAEGLADLLASEVAGKRCLLIRGDRGLATLEERLTAAGAIVTNGVVYQNVDVPLADDKILLRMESESIDFITVTSGSIAKSLVRLFGDRLRKSRLLSISPAITEILYQAGHEVFAEITDVQSNSPEFWIRTLRGGPFASFEPG